MDVGYVFSIILLIILFITIILLGVNAWYWSKIYLGTTSSTLVTPGEAGVLMWVNIALLVILVLALIYGIYGFLRTPKASTVSTTQTVAKANTVDLSGNPVVYRSVPVAATPVPVAVPSAPPLVVRPPVPVAPGQNLYRVTTATTRLGP